MAVAASRRSAQISFGAKGDGRPVRVSYPGRLTSADAARIEKVLIDDVFPGLTGCSCLSGLVPVVWEPEYLKAVQVKLDVKA